MRVVHVASEVAPFAQSGGLADVLAGLPAALAESHGLDVAVVVPLYHGVPARLHAAGIALDAGAPIAVKVGWHTFAAALRRARVGRVVYGFVDCPPLYDRPGTLYGPGGAAEFSDNHLRFAVLGKAALEHGAALLGGPIDVLHAHDWQGALAAIYARVAGTPTAIACTIHNLAYRGIFSKYVMDELGLPWSIFDLHHVEFWDQLSTLKGGLAAADVATTVSPSYAREILTPEFGEGLDAFMRDDVRRLVGIVNGIDVAAWDPGTDAALPARFTRESLAGKAVCRRELAREMGLTIEDHQPLIGVVARMTGQKGLDLVCDIVPELSALDAKLIVLGSGEPVIEERFRWLADRFTEHLAVRIGFDIGLSRRIYGGSDLFVMPSRFEPCGLGQLYAMRYGSIPVVHAVGGLRDTVIDPADQAQPGPLHLGPGDVELSHGLGTGIRFETASAEALLGALARAVRLCRNPITMGAVRRAAMARDSSWTASALQYVQLYRSIVP